MKIELHRIKVKDIFNGYQDSQENGVVGFGGKLNIRPAFQREFVYKEKERNAVIETVLKGFPLNVMYWSETETGDYELLDGQQRTISICQYLNNDFSVNAKSFNNQPKDIREQIENYELQIYICQGTESEKLDWFKIINIAGVQLKPQELRNAVYTGAWLTDAKKYFSKNGCVAYRLGHDYMNGEVNRQDYLEKVIEWLASTENLSIEEYMGAHQHDDHAAPLWQYFQNVIAWVKTIFPTWRKEMKGLEWGLLYNEFSGKNFNPQELDRRVAELMQDDEVQSKKGIYEYLLSGKEKYLSIRAFTDTQKRQVYEKQGGICPHCKNEHREKTHYEIDEMEADHITPWCEGGKTEISNCQMLCREHNRMKSSK